MAEALRSLGSTPRAGAPVALWRRFDPILTILVALLASIGTLMVYSATRDNLTARGLDPQFFVKKQFVFFMIGLCAMGVAASIDYRQLLERTPLFYVGTLVLLLGLFAVPKKKGAHGWYELGAFQLQPAEFAKYVVILSIAAYAAEQRQRIDARRFLVMLVIAGVPAGLIYLQPDLGSALVFFVIALAMSVLAGAQLRHLWRFVLLAGVGTAAGLRLGVLKAYQFDRLTSFLNSDLGSLDEGYNVAQSKIAIGSGGLRGRGLFEGTQTKYRFLPERHTDFIFSVIGEQLGLLGGVVVLALLLAIAARIWRIGVTARDHAGTLICVGVLAVLVFQVFQNVGMTMGIMPVTGLPLPLLSYGGSNTIAFCGALGLVMNVAAQRSQR
jgi:rod shape determining protein RodA